MNLLSPLEYQYPYVSILPDCHCGLIEREKCFVFGLNHRFIPDKGKEKLNFPTYFRNINLNLENKLIKCDIDTGNAYQFYYKIDEYHVVNFNDLGVYPEVPGNMTDTSQLISKNIYSGKIKNANDIKLPDKITNKLSKDLASYALKNNEKIQSDDYSPEFNKIIGEDFFYTYLV